MHLFYPYLAISLGYFQLLRPTKWISNLHFNALRCFVDTMMNFGIGADSTFILYYLYRCCSWWNMGLARIHLRWHFAITALNALILGLVAAVLVIVKSFSRSFSFLDLNFLRCCYLNGSINFILQFDLDWVISRIVFGLFVEMTTCHSSTVALEIGKPYCWSCSSTNWFQIGYAYSSYLKLDCRYSHLVPYFPITLLAGQHFQLLFCLCLSGLQHAYCLDLHYTRFRSHSWSAAELGSCCFFDARFWKAYHLLLRFLRHSGSQHCRCLGSLV